MKWVKVSERLPEQGQKVLAIGTLLRGKNSIDENLDITDMFVVTFHQSQQMIKNGAIRNNWSFPVLNGLNGLWNVTHWAELPEPPKDQEPEWGSNTPINKMLKSSANPQDAYNIFKIETKDQE